MKLTVERDNRTPYFTAGRLLIDGVFECWTLEDPLRDGPKVAGDTAIPYGTYKLTVTPSARFKRPMPLVNDVPGFSGIRIHAGNTTDDTEGCLLVGDVRKTGTIAQSAVAFNRLFTKLQAALAAGETITITYI